MKLSKTILLAFLLPIGLTNTDSFAANGIELDQSSSRQAPHLLTESKHKIGRVKLADLQQSNPLGLVLNQLNLDTQNRCNLTDFNSQELQKFIGQASLAVIKMNQAAKFTIKTQYGGSLERQLSTSHSQQKAFNAHLRYQSGPGNRRYTEQLAEQDRDGIVQAHQNIQAILSELSSICQRVQDFQGGGQLLNQLYQLWDQIDGDKRKAGLETIKLRNKIV